MCHITRLDAGQNNQSSLKLRTGHAASRHLQPAPCPRPDFGCAAQVERQGEVWVQPSDGAVCHVMRRRYVLQAQCADFSGQAYLQFFNDQVPSLARNPAPCTLNPPRSRS